MEWYYVWWPWLTYKCIAQVCQYQLSFWFFFYSILLWSVAVSTMRHQSSRIAAFLQADARPLFSWSTAGSQKWLSLPNGHFQLGCYFQITTAIAWCWWWHNNTRNSPVADKLRYAFVQLQWRGWPKTRPSTYVLPCRIWSFCVKECRQYIQQKNPKNWRALELYSLVMVVVADPKIHAPPQHVLPRQIW